MNDRFDSDLLLIDRDEQAREQGGRPVSTPAELAAAREDLGLSQREVAGHFRLRERQLDALERGDYDALPGLAYVRALVRAYARLVGVDARPLIGAIGGFGQAAELNPTMDPSAAVPAGGAAWERPRRAGFALGWRQWAIGAGVLAGLALLVVFGALLTVDGQALQPDGDSRVIAVPIPGTAPAIASRSGPTVGVPTSTVPAPMAAPRRIGLRPNAEAAAPTAQAAAGAQAVSPSGQLVGPSPQAEKPGSDVQPFMVSKLADGPPAAAAGSGDEAAPLNFPVKLPPTERVRLKVSKATWIEVWHKDDEKLMYGTQRPSGWITLDGVPPMRVVVGNPAAVQVEFRGQPVDMSDKTSRGVARFVLN
ncbi:MAG: DUF4115 domain-containing protein [Burkholderiaceae bacterium]